MDLLAIELHIAVYAETLQVMDILFLHLTSLMVQHTMQDYKVENKNIGLVTMIIRILNAMKDNYNTERLKL